MQAICVGRQPIYDRERRVNAYELLYRSAEVNPGDAAFDGDQASASVVLHTLTNIGLDPLVGRRRAFINCTRRSILDGGLTLLPPDRVVLEVLEDVSADGEVLGALRELRERGYRIALDDFVLTANTELLLPLAQMVKVDILNIPEAELPVLTAHLKSLGAELLAEKVETAEQFAHCIELGYTLFQGYYLSRPEIVHGQSLAGNQMALLQVISALNDPQVESEDLIKIVGRDAALSATLLRQVNSAYYKLPREIESIGQAVILLGTVQLRRLATLLVLARLAPGRDEDLISGLTRARVCQRLLAHSHPGLAEPAYLAGLLSVLDALTQRPLDEAIANLPLGEDVRDALLQRGGPIGNALECALAYEATDWTRVEELGFRLFEAGAIYVEALGESYRELHG